jgi:hypothetical protein
MMGMFGTRKCWSARGMSGQESAGPPKGMFYPSSAGTLRSVKSIVTSVERICHCVQTIHNSGLFLLFW